MKNSQFMECSKVRIKKSDELDYDNAENKKKEEFYT